MIDEIEVIPTETEVTEVPPAEVQQPQESSQQLNFRNLREAKERAERERDELLGRFQEQERQRTQAQTQSVQQDDENLDIGQDDIVEGKHLSKVGRKLKRLEEELRSYKQQSTTSVAEARIKAQYPDFDKVVTKDNISSLRELYPELAHTLNSSTDLYNTASSAYTLIKKFGIYQEDIYMADRARAQANAAKPKPLAAVTPQQGDSPLSHANAFANGLTDDLRKNLLKEMHEAMKNR
jgi:hypothetical protein